MIRVSLAALLCLSAAPLALASEEEPADPRPTLELVGDVRLPIEEGDTGIVAAMSPSGRHMAIACEPRSDASRRSDTWTRVRLVDVPAAELAGSWSGDVGRLPPAFSTGGHLFAWGSRTDAKTLKIDVRACTTRRGIRFDVAHEPRSQGFAEVCGVSNDSRRVAVREPADAEGRRDLVIYQAPADRIARFPAVAERGRSSGVVLTGPQIIFHARAEEDDGNRRLRLRVVELDTSRVVADRSTFASRTTPGFALTPDRKRLLNGTRDFQIEVVDLASGEARALLDASDLGSHWLELRLCGDGKRVVAWSDERKLILARDLDGGEPLRVELGYRAHVVGISDDGRWAYVKVTGRGLVAVDIDAGEERGVIADDLADWVRITPDGRHLVEGVRDEKGWTFAVFALKTP